MYSQCRGRLKVLLLKSKRKFEANYYWWLCTCTSSSLWYLTFVQSSSGHLLKQTFLSQSNLKTEGWKACRQREKLSSGCDSARRRNHRMPSKLSSSIALQHSWSLQPILSVYLTSFSHSSNSILCASPAHPISDMKKAAPLRKPQQLMLPHHNPQRHL